ncbi:hypothetical protein SRABI118_02725 [Massilia sp. Bi118]|uniref:PEP-CTERM sorting domain-containing protein n=1 Tax=Massilia sp. Bi118 TaxID=2822346 RepID=UPI001DA2E2C7|nr:PEP-CTERM sorting domain-containing protein [Massilia sp. Bi118]CAH0241416.1 hypothetical protein SRABI118_02725 [Massilia sp. Bi118]
MKILLASLALAFASSANAAVITSTSDAALAGASIQTFDNVAEGYYASLSLPGVTVVGNGGPMHIDSENSAYGMGGRSLNNYFGSPSSFDLIFDAPVTAFGIYGGAVNSPWVYTAYDAAGGVLETYTTPGTCCDPMFYGFANNAGIARVNLSSDGDWVLFDNLYMATAVQADVPEPASLALFGAAFAGIASVRRKRTRG